MVHLAPVVAPIEKHQPLLARLQVMLPARRDFREFLGAWYRPSAARLMLAPLVTRLWKNRGRCAHRLGPHWCRAREKEIRAPELGRIS